MRPLLFALCTAAVIASLAPPRATADIVQAASSTSTSLVVVSHFGQSFTATASETHVASVSFAWSSVNLGLIDPTITVRLRSGVGFGGPVLAMDTVSSIPQSTPSGAWIDFFFASPAPLMPGEQYSLQFTKESGALVSGGYRAAPTDVYSDGVFVDSGGVVNPGADLAFRVTAAIPEASACAFGAVASAVVAIRWWFRRRFPAHLS